MTKKKNQPLDHKDSKEKKDKDKMVSNNKDIKPKDNENKNAKEIKNIKDNKEIVTAKETKDIKSQIETKENKDKSIDKKENPKTFDETMKDERKEPLKFPDKTLSIEEEIKAIKDKKKGIEKEEKDDKEEKIALKEETKEMQLDNNQNLDLFSMIENEETEEIEIKQLTKEDKEELSLKDEKVEPEMTIKTPEKINNQNINKDKVKKSDKEKEINDSINLDKPKKSKFIIFLLILAILGLIYYSVNLYFHLDMQNLVITDLVKSGTFLLLSLLIILILFKVNSKKLTPYVLILTIVLLSYVAFGASYSLPSDNYVLDFINKDITEVMEWANDNHIELEILKEYSDTVLKNHVIMQEYSIKTLVKDVKSPFKVTISLGPNYDKSLVVPNLTGFTFDEVMTYIKENNLNNVEIEFMVSSEKRDTVIEQIGSGTMKRNDKIIFKFSYGEELPEPTMVKDLTNLSEFEATAYLKRYNIPYEITYSFDKKILKGYVVKQSVVNEIVTDKLILTVSKGNEILVPDFLKMSETEITKWAMENNINIVFDEIYSSDYEKGKVVKSSHDTNSKVNENDTITITISKGSLTMPKIENLAEFKLWAMENNVKYQENMEFSDDVKAGEIIKYEPKEGTKLSENDTIIITISSGKQITIPYFVGMSKSNIQARCNTLNLSCSFVYGGYSDTTARDVAIKQSKSSGTVVAEGTNLTITLSSGVHEKVTVPSFTGKTRNQINDICASLGITCKFINNGSYSNETKDTALRQDKTGTVYKGDTVTITLSIGPAQSYTVIIDASLLSQGNAEQTKNTLQKLLSEKCPGVNFTFTFQPANYGIGYLSENSEVHVGQNSFTQGKTYKVIINTGS